MAAPLLWAGCLFMLVCAGVSFLRSAPPLVRRKDAFETPPLRHSMIRLPPVNGAASSSLSAQMRGTTLWCALCVLRFVGVEAVLSHRISVLMQWLLLLLALRLHLVAHDEELRRLDADVQVLAPVLLLLGPQR